MRAVKLIILHPLGIIGRKSVIFHENAQFSFFFFRVNNYLKCFKKYELFCFRLTPFETDELITNCDRFKPLKSPHHH